MRRTKIVCTLGPSSYRPDVIRKLIEAGMDVARLNFSHGTHADHRAAFDTVRGLARDVGRNVAILMDLQGPKIRTGPLASGTVALIEGAAICLTTRNVPGDQQVVSTSYAHLPQDVKPGDRILLADGAMELAVERVEPPDTHCRVVRGGTLGERKGINLPGVRVSAPALTEKDVDDLAFGLDLGVDYVALSFVRTADDIRGIQRRIAEAKATTGVVAKIERPEALANFDAILAETDAVMVARGDLGVEAPLGDVPQIQKELIRKCNAAGKPVITATQMLESMVDHMRPTRAEVTDVANAIYDGTDAVMLSAETAAGQFPVEAVAVMADVAQKADVAMAKNPPRPTAPRTGAASDAEGLFSDAIGDAVCHIIPMLPVARIVCFTQSGFTAGAIARYRPPVPITAMTLSETTRRRCALLWGVEAIVVEDVNDADALFQNVDDALLAHRLAAPGDTVIIAAGTPMAAAGRTNLLKLQVVGGRTN